MTFVDSNIPRRLTGAVHRHKAEGQLPLERLIAAGRRLVTDAEALRETLQRYTAIDRREALGPVPQTTLDIGDEVVPIERAEVLRAGEIAQHHALLSTRAAVHSAVMERHGV